MSKTLPKRDIRTPNKQLLIGTIIKDNGGLFLLIKSRGKTDSIALDVLITSLTQEKNKYKSNHP